MKKGKEKIDKYMQYEVSMPAYAGQDSKSKLQNGCYLKTTNQNHKIFDVHILRTHEHIHTKYEVSMFNHVTRRGVQKQCQC